MSFHYFIPTRILFGAGQLKKLHEQELPGKKALIVISSGKSVRENGYLATLEDQLRQAKVDYAVFDEILPNPTKDNVMNGAACAKANGCDFVIGLGGGSSIDAAKSIALMAVNEGDYWDYIDAGSGKGKAPAKDPLPIVAITTTAGTGTEADPWTVVTKTDTCEKIGWGYDKTFPTLAIVDPELMETVPPRLTAYQGFDALFHSTEAHISCKANMMSDMFARRAIELIGRSLVRAVKDGGDKEARADVALANTLSGIVMCVGSTTSEHSLEHALSAFHHELPHGAGLIMISKAYYAHFAKAGVCDEKMVDMARALGMENASKPMDFVEQLGKLQEACGVADLKMSDYGIRQEELRKYAVNAKDTMGGLFEADPCPLSEDDCVAIYEASYR